MRTVVLLLVLLSATVHGASVTWAIANSNESFTLIQISGSIVNGDLNKVKQALSEAPPRSQHGPFLGWHSMVRIDSDGGDVEEAMAIGRALRAQAAPVDAGECVGTCVLILAAGVQRYANRVGIHRPYRIDPIASRRSGKWQYAPMSKQVGDYLHEMGMPKRLYEEMMRVPFESLRWLTAAELKEFGLVGMDSTYSDANDVRQAARYGVSKAEYLSRQARALRDCGQFPERPFEAEMKAWKGCYEPRIRGER